MSVFVWLKPWRNWQQLTGKEYSKEISKRSCIKKANPRLINMLEELVVKVHDPKTDLWQRIS